MVNICGLVLLQHNSPDSTYQGSSMHIEFNLDSLSSSSHLPPLPSCQEAKPGADPPTPHLRSQVDMMNRLDTTQLEATCLKPFNPGCGALGCEFVRDLESMS